ncbi:hypothetical protein ACWGJT_18515 [Streptomyces xantholiticus]|uniref:Uncharacterized protein n=1 Tax=Streptomyces xantholiticus TaxID=68285 RepID=A0ABV1UWB9_9ACTN|nr:hypothetical protein [Streptomyces xantholiticus]ATW49603.1 hypothetical protein CGZ69_18630 [Streptomyces peucetius subsp. caesius ATCC 27952]GGW60372.1 hypothetical protein GCM10010381_52050 [Streptomyces xantholiticus]
MFLNKVNQDVSLEDFVAERGPEARIAPIMATPAIFTPAAVKVGVSAGAAAAAYMATKVK